MKSGGEGKIIRLDKIICTHNVVAMTPFHPQLKYIPKLFSSVIMHYGVVGAFFV